jgi:hypothetical protein
LRQRLKLGNPQDSGTAKFYLKTTQMEVPTELRLERDANGSFSLINGFEAVAKLTPITEAPLPKSMLPFEVDRFNLINVSGTVAGFMLTSPIENGFKLDYSTFSSASYSSKVGFYLTDIRFGLCVDPLTGQMVSVNSISSDEIDQYSVYESDIVTNNATRQAAFKLDQSIDVRNIVFTPYIKTSTGQSTYLYGCDAALNPDGFDHIAKIGHRVFGVEDMFGGGDRDFNDILFSFNSIQAL